MRRRLRLAAVALALVLPGAALARFVAVQGAGAGEIYLGQLPRTIGPWSVRSERALTRDEREQLRPDGYTARLYEAPGRPPIWLYVALYAGRSQYGKGAHDPTICYPAQGWEVLSTRSLEVALPAGEQLVGTLLLAHQGRAEQKVLYWFQPARRWPKSQSREQLARIWDAMLGRPQYAFVRLAASSLPGADAERDLLEFAREISWPVRQALSPGESAAAPASDRS